MTSEALPSFWNAYRALDDGVRRSAINAFRLWQANPFHPSLRFKQVDPKRNVWSVRISRGYRALCIRSADRVTWYWIGSHDEYLRHLS